MLHTVAIVIRITVPVKLIYLHLTYHFIYQYLIFGFNDL